MNATQNIGLIYCGISVLCALILIFNAKAVSEVNPRYSVTRYVMFSYLFAGLAAIFDCTFPLREIVGISFHPAVSYILTVSYVLCAEFTGMFWIIYAEIEQNSWVSRSRKRFLIFMIPLFALVLLTVTTPLTRLYFYFEGNTYKRGPLFVLMSSLLFAYVVQNGVKSFIRSLKKENYVERHALRRQVAYAFGYLLIQGIQLLLPSIFPYRSVGTMLIFGIFLIQSMQEAIGSDALTRISNRNSIDHHLGNLMSQKADFEIVLMDVDKFKNINDKYGHVEGDTALKLVAEAIKEASPKNSFFARWGGDEFMVINSDQSLSISDIEEKINRCLDDLTRNREYRISVSAGYFTKDGSIKSIPDLLKEVDGRLYARKESKR